MKKFSVSLNYSPFDNVDIVITVKNIVTSNSLEILHIWKMAFEWKMRTLFMFLTCGLPAPLITFNSLISLSHPDLPFAFSHPFAHFKHFLVTSCRNPWISKPSVRELVSERWVLVGSFLFYLKLGDTTFAKSVSLGSLHLHRHRDEWKPEVPRSPVTLGLPMLLTRDRDLSAVDHIDVLFSQTFFANPGICAFQGYQEDRMYPSLSFNYSNISTSKWGLAIIGI